MVSQVLTCGPLAGGTPDARRPMPDVVGPPTGAERSATLARQGWESKRKYRHSATYYVNSRNLPDSSRGTRGTWARRPHLGVRNAFS
jgi:hypothetical protein